MQLVFSADRNYLDFLLVALDSALRTTTAHSRVAILSTDFSTYEKQVVGKLADHYGASVTFPRIHRREHRVLPDLLHLSLNTYLRLYAADELRDSDRLMYLDCDLVVKQDLSALWETDMRGCPVAAAPMLNASYGADFVVKHGLPARHRYFNAGVLLIDAKTWRQEGSSDKLLNWLSEHRDSMVFADQDALNAVFAGRVCPLHPQWNCESRLFREQNFPGVQRLQEITEAICDPAIIHYTGPIKPWSDRGFCPRRKDFWQHANGVSAVTGRDTSGYRYKNRITDQLRNKSSMARMHAAFSIRQWFPAS